MIQIVIMDNNKKYSYYTNTKAVSKRTRFNQQIIRNKIYYHDYYNQWTYLLELRCLNINLLLAKNYSYSILNDKNETKNFSCHFSKLLSLFY